jgi:hypothetical protein
MSKIFRYILITIASISIIACSGSKVSNEIDYKGIGELQSKDYIDHLAAASGDYLSYEETKTVKLRPESIEYLEEVYDRIVSNNQLILDEADRPRFYIIEHKSPFLFSLPKAQFFFSTALVERYLKSEEIFVAAFAAEIIRSQRAIYEKTILLPVGFYNTEKMIHLTRLKFETKEQVNEWTYFVLKRAGYDSSAYLNWIQIQNRNTLDFSLFLGDSAGISKEEHLFKNFITKQGVTGVDKRFNEANSSKEFYKLLNNIVGKK